MARSLLNTAIYSACLSRLFSPHFSTSVHFFISLFLIFSPPACGASSGGSIGFKAAAAVALMNQACVFVKQTGLWRSTGGEFVFVLYLSVTLSWLFVPAWNTAATETAQLGRNSRLQLLTSDLLLLPLSENMMCADNWIAQEIKFIQSWWFYFMAVYHTAVLQPQILSFSPAVFSSPLKNAALNNYLTTLESKLQPPHPQLHATPVQMAGKPPRSPAILLEAQSSMKKIRKSE